MMFGIKLGKKKTDRKDRKKAIGDFLDDLTNLEINTIISSGMVAGAPPKSAEELLSGIFSNYKSRVSTLIKTNKLNFRFREDRCTSLKQLEESIAKLRKYMDADLDHRRMKDNDFPLIRRMDKFLKLIKHIDKDIDIKSEGVVHTSVYDYPSIEQAATFKIVQLSNEILIKLKYYYDLGTEKVILQTRFGIDGDVVNRVEKDFAENPNTAIMNMHERHTQMSVNYWELLVELSVRLMGQIFDNLTGTSDEPAS